MATEGTCVGCHESRPSQLEFPLPGWNVEPRNAGYALGVEAVVTGRVERRGDALRIRVKLIDARDNRQVWGAEFDRSPADPLLAQREIARITSNKMRAHLVGAPQQVVEETSANSQAYEPLLRGDFYRTARGVENRRKAVLAYQQAIAIDPDYALAYARLSESYRHLVNAGLGDPRELASLALSAAQRASELDPDLAEAQLELANLHLDAWNWAEADARFQRAIELNPNLPRARRNYAAYLSIVGRSHDAMVEANRTRHLDPLAVRACGSSSARPTPKRATTAGREPSSRSCGRADATSHQASWRRYTASC